MLTLSTAIQNGFWRATQRPKLILGIYFLQTFIAFLLTQPIFDTLNAVTASSTFVPELLSRHSALLWIEILQIIKDKLLAWSALILATLPTLWLLGIWSKLGVANALNPDASGSFWQALKSFGFKSLHLAILFSLMSLVWSGICVFIAFIALSSFSDEVSIFWIGFILVPFLLLMGWNFIQLFHDYARCLLLRNLYVSEAFFKSFGFVFRNKKTILNYSYFFATTFFIFFFVGGFGNFWLRQCLLFGQQWVKNAWLGANNVFFEQE